MYSVHCTVYMILFIVMTVFLLECFKLTDTVGVVVNICIVINILLTKITTAQNEGALS